MPEKQGMEASAPAPQADIQTPRRLIPLLWVVVIAIFLAFAYFASSLCIACLVSGFLAILCDPVPTYLERWRVPRAISAVILIFLGTVLFSLGIRASYSQVSSFIDNIPDYADRIREVLDPLRQNIEKVQKTAGTLNPDNIPKKGIPEVRVKQSSADLQSSGRDSSFAQAVAAILIRSPDSLRSFPGQRRANRQQRLIASLLPRPQ